MFLFATMAGYELQPGESVSLTFDNGENYTVSRDKAGYVYVSANNQYSRARMDEYLEEMDEEEEEDDWSYNPCLD